MEPNKNGEEKKETTPVPTPGLNEDGTPKTPVEDNKGAEDIDFEKQLAELEKEEKSPDSSKPQRTELEKAEFTAKNVLKRIKDLGGDPSKFLPDDAPSAPEVDTSKFVTKLDLARQEAAKLARGDKELEVIMWYVKNRNLSVEEAHLLANKGRIKNATKEIQRANEATPSNGGGPGERTPERKTAKMDEKNEQRLFKVGMVHDPATNTYTGKRTRIRHDGVKWVSERLVNGQWKVIPSASDYD